MHWHSLPEDFGHFATKKKAHFNLPAEREKRKTAKEENGQGGVHEFSRVRDRSPLSQMLRAGANGETFVSATMCPQQCVLVWQGLNIVSVRENCCEVDYE